MSSLLAIGRRKRGERGYIQLIPSSSFAADDCGKRSPRKAGTISDISARFLERHIRWELEMNLARTFCGAKRLDKTN